MNTRRKGKGIAIPTILILSALIIATAAPTVAFAEEPPTAFVIFGHVFYENGDECNHPYVNITNLNSGTMWPAETDESSNYYQLTLMHSADIAADETLQFDVKSPDGSQVNITPRTITQQDINGGGLFNFNISLAGTALIHDINVTTDYEGAVNGIKLIKNGTAIPEGQSLIIGEDYTIRSRIVNEGDFDETVNVTIKVANGTGAVFLQNFDKIINVSDSKDAYRTWNTSGLAPGEYNITVNASIPEDENTEDNKRLRQVMLVLEPVYDVSITSAQAGQTTAPDVNATYVLTITNLGNVADTIELNITANEANYSSRSADNFILDAGTNATAYLNVKDPEAGTYNTTVRATSQGNTSVFNEVTVKTNVTTVEPVYNVSIISEQTELATAPNENATYMLRIKNTGNKEDNFTLSVDNQDEAAIANLSTYSVTQLAANDNTTVLLNVTDAVAGTYRVNVTATSEGDTSKFDFVNTTTTVGTVPPLVPPVIIDWYNNKTNDNSLEITVNVSEGLYFNATANQTIDTWHWFKDGFDQERNYNNFTTSWTVAGLHEVSVHGENENGTSNTMLWNVTVVTEEEGAPTADYLEVVDANGCSGTYVEVPVKIKNVQNGSIQGMRFSIEYNETVLNLTNISGVDLTTSWTLEFGEDGQSMIIATGDTGAAIPVGSSGSVVLLNFSVLGAPEDTSPMNLTSIELSNPDGMVGTAPAVNGTFTVVTDVLTADYLEIANASGRSGTHVEMPVNIANVSNGPVEGIRLRIDYNESVLNLTNIAGSDLTMNWTQLRLGEDRHTMFIGTEYVGDAISDGCSGTVVLLNFSVIGAPGDTSSMDLSLIELADPKGTLGTAPAKNGVFIVPNLGTIAGRITYACNGTEIAGVVVNLTEAGSVVDTTVTNETGYYSFTDVNLDTYFVNASKPQFFENSTEVAVIAGETTIEDMMLWLKGDLNSNCNSADAGDVVLMLRASVQDIPGDWRYDLNENGVIADAGDVLLMLKASVGDIVLL